MARTKWRPVDTRTRVSKADKELTKEQKNRRRTEWKYEFPKLENNNAPVNRNDFLNSKSGDAKGALVEFFRREERKATEIGYEIPKAHQQTSLDASRTYDFIAKEAIGFNKTKTTIDLALNILESATPSTFRQAATLISKILKNFSPNPSAKERKARERASITPLSEDFRAQVKERITALFTNEKTALQIAAYVPEQTQKSIQESLGISKAIIIKNEKPASYEEVMAKLAGIQARQREQKLELMHQAPQQKPPTISRQKHKGANLGVQPSTSSNSETKNNKPKNNQTVNRSTEKPKKTSSNFVGNLYLDITKDPGYAYQLELGKSVSDNTWSKRTTSNKIASYANSFASPGELEKQYGTSFLAGITSKMIDIHRSPDLLNFIWGEGPNSLNLARPKGINYMDLDRDESNNLSQNDRAIKYIKQYTFYEAREILLQLVDKANKLNEPFLPLAEFYTNIWDAAGSLQDIEYSAEDTLESRDVYGLMLARYLLRAMDSFPFSKSEYKKPLVTMEEHKIAQAKSDTTTEKANPELYLDIQRDPQTPWLLNIETSLDEEICKKRANSCIAVHLDKFGFRDDIEEDTPDLSDIANSMIKTHRRLDLLKFLWGKGANCLALPRPKAARHMNLDRQEVRNLSQERRATEYFGKYTVGEAREILLMLVDKANNLTEPNLPLGNFYSGIIEASTELNKIQGSAEQKLKDSGDAFHAGVLLLIAIENFPFTLSEYNNPLVTMEEYKKMNPEKEIIETKEVDFHSDDEFYPPLTNDKLKITINGNKGMGFDLKAPWSSDIGDLMGGTTIERRKFTKQFADFDKLCEKFSSEEESFRCDDEARLTRKFIDEIREADPITFIWNNSPLKLEEPSKQAKDFDTSGQKDDYFESLEQAKTNLESYTARELQDILKRVINYANDTSEDFLVNWAFYDDLFNANASLQKIDTADADIEISELKTWVADIEQHFFNLLMRIPIRKSEFDAAPAID